MDTATQQVAVPITIPELQDGETYAGLSRDPETGAWHHLILLPVLSGDLNWQGAIDWARSVGGELPTRFESALLYANARDKIDTDYWYWTATQFAGGDAYAWFQGFLNGNQLSDRKDY